MRKTMELTLEQDYSNVSNRLNQLHDEWRFARYDVVDEIPENVRKERAGLALRKIELAAVRWSLVPALLRREFGDLLFAVKKAIKIAEDKALALKAKANAKG